MTPKNEPYKMFVKTKRVKMSRILNLQLNIMGKIE